MDKSKRQAMQFNIRPITAASRSDFYRVHCTENGAGWCNCIAWWVPTWNDWDSRTERQNHDFREQLFDQGHYDGYMLYADGKPVAWCQCGPRDRLEKLCRQYNLPQNPEIWAISCFVVVPAWRGQGIAHKLIDGILGELSRYGVKHVQGFPKCGTNLEAGDVWTGPEAVFRKAGFEVELPHESWPIYGKSLGS